jgi:hypothetical protein
MDGSHKDDSSGSSFNTVSPISKYLKATLNFQVFGSEASKSSST